MQSFQILDRFWVNQHRAKSWQYKVSMKQVRVKTSVRLSRERKVRLTQWGDIIPNTDSTNTMPTTSLMKLYLGILMWAYLANLVGFSSPNIEELVSITLDLNLPFNLPNLSHFQPSSDFNFYMRQSPFRRLYNFGWKWNKHLKGCFIYRTTRYDRRSQQNWRFLG